MFCALHDEDVDKQFCEDCEEYDVCWETVDDSYEYFMEHGYDPREFADPGGRSALRAGPRIHPCPTCGQPNRLSDKDVQLGYQCDSCADALEQGLDIYYA